MKILLPTDSFPPNCGGSGWSTYELARGLVERGHDVLVVKVIAGKSGAEVSTAYNGIPVIDATPMRRPFQASGTTSRTSVSIHGSPAASTN